MIKKIILDLGGQEVVLTTKQAKRLKEELDELFGSKKVIEYRDRWYWNPPSWTSGVVFTNDACSTDTLVLNASSQSSGYTN